MTDTIFAPASGPAPAAITIIRMSGPDAHVMAERIAGRLPPPRFASLRSLRSPNTQELLDTALVLRFDAPASATGEDLVELHVHGSRAVLAAVGTALTDLGARGAEPGEFTRRALEHGRIDLSQAEGLADLLEAETETQRRSALRMAEGGMRQQIAAWRTRLLELLASIEAEIEFSEDDDLDMQLGAVSQAVRTLAADVRTMLDRPPAERIRDGFRVVLAGAPNRGKSSVFNRLIGREAAIVTPVAGTTRDIIEAHVVRDGTAFTLIDTAGLSESDDTVERIGIDRARAALSAGDLILWFGPGEAPVDNALVVQSFGDLSSEGAGVLVSGLTGAGIDRLWGQILAQALSTLPPDDGITANLRQRGAPSGGPP